MKKALEDAVKAANTLLTSTDQPTIDEATETLKTATQTFVDGANSGTPSLDYSKLDKSVDSALTLLNTTTIGAAVGNVSLADWKVFSSERKDANTARTNAKTQADIDDAQDVLDLAIIEFLSKINGVSVNSNSAVISVYPTVTSESITIEGLTGTTTISVSSSLGMITKPATTVDSKVELSVAKFAKGLNIVTTVSTDGTTSTTSIIVE